MPSEFSLIARYFKRPAQSQSQCVLGVGDDAAIVRPSPGMEMVTAADMLVAGTHFLPDDAAQDLGWKTLAVNVSDLAAMGAQPRWALLSLALPATLANNADWLAAYSQGFFACASAHGIDLIGGDTTRGPLSFGVTLLGEIPAGQALLRSAARAGDDIWISGTPGHAALGLAQRQGRCQLPASMQQRCLSALHRPQPRLALGLALAREQLAHAAIDVSDGLLADLGHILAASQQAAVLHFAQLPLPATSTMPTMPTQLAPQLALNCLLGGGDDYELAFTAPAGQHANILALGTRLQLPLHCIGRISHGPAGHIRLLDAAGQDMQTTLDAVQRGYDHFASLAT